MKVLILASGKKSQTDFPFCLTEFSGTPLLELLISECAAFPDAELIVSAPHEDIQRYKLDSILNLISPKIRLISIENETRGAACTALLAIDHIDNDEELLILNGNELIEVDFADVAQEFREGKFAAGVITFPSLHPRYSFVRIGKDGYVTEVAEKRPISRNATAGFYWFAKGSYFVEAALESIRNDEVVEGKYYVSPTLNHLILKGCAIGRREIQANQFHPLKDDKQIRDFSRVPGTHR